MCTSIIEIARAERMAKRGDEWLPLSQYEEAEVRGKAVVLRLARAG